MPGSTSYDRIHHRVDMVPLAQGGEGGEAEACIRPQRGHDKLLAAGAHPQARSRAQRWPTVSGQTSRDA